MKVVERRLFKNAVSQNKECAVKSIGVMDEQAWHVRYRNTSSALWIQLEKQHNKLHILSEQTTNPWF